MDSENGMVGAGHGDEGRVCFEADERASHCTRDECMRDAVRVRGVQFSSFVRFAARLLGA